MYQAINDEYKSASVLFPRRLRAIVAVLRRSVLYRVLDDEFYQMILAAEAGY